MPVHVPVPDLTAITMYKAADLITRVLESRLHELPTDEFILNVVQNFLSLIPIYIKEELLHYILELEDDDIIRYAALKIMLCPQMKTLRTYIFPQTYFKRVAAVIEFQGLALELLDLRGVWLKGKLEYELQKILGKLKNLQVLHIPHVATDKVLEIIGQSDPPLKILDIRGECNITNVGIEMLCESPQSAIIKNLNIVVLGNPSGVEVSPQNTSILIKNLPNLESLGSYPYVRKAIELLVEDNGIFTTQIINLQDSNTDINSINLLYQTCPKLKSLYLDHPCPSAIPFLTRFNHLNRIKINKFHVNEICSFLEGSGQKLVTIELISGVGVLDLSHLSNFCLHLESLTCYHMECVRHLGPILFNDLKAIEISYSDITTSSVKSIILGSPNIEKLSFGDILDINDNDIKEVFTSKDYVNLKSLWLPNAVYLTSNCIKILIDICPNLVKLGVISGWNVTQEEALTIQEEIQLKNFALKLIEYF